MIDLDLINWQKVDGLLPAIVQDHVRGHVLMLGYMNRESLEKTIKTKQVTFFSRTKNRLWTKGESSGHFLNVKDLALDCDQDALLIKAQPQGPTCHLGSQTCFGEAEDDPRDFLKILESIIEDRINEPHPDSYTTKLMTKGLVKIAQKVGEEGVETALAASCESPERLADEAADLVYHLLLLLKARGLNLSTVADVLIKRHR